MTSSRRALQPETKEADAINANVTPKAVIRRVNPKNFFTNTTPPESMSGKRTT